MKIGKLLVPASMLFDPDVLAFVERLNINNREYIEWSDFYEITAVSDIFPDVPRYSDDPIPIYNLAIVTELTGEKTFKAEPR